MTFGEKIRELRNAKGWNQTQLAEAAGVSLRTVRGWEKEGRYPKKRDLYQKLSEILDCDPSYLMSDGADFISTAAEQYGSRGERQARLILDQERQARLILDQTATMFAGGALTDADKAAFMEEIQMLYLDSKERAKKFTPKKYRKSDEGDKA